MSRRSAAGADPETFILRGIRKRLEALRAQGLDPIEVVMNAKIWDRLQAEHRVITPGLLGRLAGRDVLGSRVKVLPACDGIVIRYFGGVEVVEHT